jgi:hypothetical protein
MLLSFRKSVKTVFSWQASFVLCRVNPYIDFTPHCQKKPGNFRGQFLDAQGDRKKEGGKFLLHEFAGVGKMVKICVSSDEVEQVNKTQNDTEYTDLH